MYVDGMPNVYNLATINLFWFLGKDISSYGTSVAVLPHTHSLPAVAVFLHWL